MRHRRTTSAGLGLCLALAASACTSAPSVPLDESTAAPSDATNVPAAAGLPLDGEELVFAIELAGLPIGHATLTTRRAGEEVRVEAKGETNAVVDLFCEVRGVARARLEPDGRSKTFYLWVDEDGKESERALAFDAIPCIYYKTYGQDAWVASLTQYVAPRDPLGLLAELRRLDPSAPSRDFEVAMTLRSYCYRARYLGREDVDVGAGHFVEALRWRVEVRPYRELGVENAEVGPIVGFYEVLLSADERRLPLRLARAFGFGTIALELKSSGPASPEVAGSDGDDESARSLVSSAGASAPAR